MSFSNDAEFLASVSSWHQKKLAIAAEVANERALRSEIIAHKFGEVTEPGTYRHGLDAANDLKFENKLDYKVTGSNDEVTAMLEKLGKCGNDGSFVADRLVKWKAEISVSEYKKLTEEQRKIVDTVLTIKPGSPTLEICKPSARKG